MGTEGAGMGKRLRGGAPVPHRSPVLVADPALGAFGHGTEGKSVSRPSSRAAMELPSVKPSGGENHRAAFDFVRRFGLRDVADSVQPYVL